jgi:primosomal protein N' (replication factor Y) (superfamily II helicase)
MDHPTRTSTSAATSTNVVDVLVPVALNQTYSYRVPRGMELEAGDVVAVPLGPREVIGVV